MLRIYSDGEDIMIRTGKNEIIGNLIYELAQVCEAVIRTLAKDAGCNPDKLKRCLLYILQKEESELEFMGNETGTLRVLYN